MTDIKINPLTWLPDEVGDAWFVCENPTSVTIQNRSYSPIQDLGNNLLYVSWSCQANGISVTMYAVINTVTWKVISNAEAQALYNKKSTIEHWAWDVLGIGSGNIQGWEWEIIVCWEIFFTPQWNLWIVLSGVSSVNAWSNGVLTLTITNNWPDTTEDTVVQGILPSWVNYVSDDSDAIVDWQEITRELGTLISGQSVVINMTLEFVTGGNASLVFGVWSTTTDPNPWNDTATRNVAVLQWDLAITLSWVTSTPALWNFTQTVSVINNWPTLVNNAVATVVLPVGLDFVSAGAGSYNAWTRTRTWNIWTINNWANPSANLTLISSTVASYEITGNITSTTPDWTPANNDTTRNISITKASFDIQARNQSQINNNTDLRFDFRAWDWSTPVWWEINSIQEEALFIASFSFFWVPATITWAISWLTIEVDYPVWFTYDSFYTLNSNVLVFVSNDTINRKLIFQPWSSWNINDGLILFKNKCFGIVGSCDTTWAVTFTATAILDSVLYEDFNLSNNSTTTGITITEPPVPIEIRVSNDWFGALTSFDLEQIYWVYITIWATDYTSSFTLDAWDISWTSFRLGYFTWPTGHIPGNGFGFNLYADYAVPFWWYDYTQDDPTTIAVEPL